MELAEQRKQKAQATLDNIRAIKVVPSMLECAIVVGLFAEEEFWSGLKADTLGERVPKGGLFSEGNARAQIENALSLLVEYKFLFRYPDGAYCYRYFED